MLRPIVVCNRTPWSPQALLTGRFSNESRLSAEIAKNLIAAQDSDGAWVADQPSHTRLDQSAEVAIWLLEIAARR